MKPVNSLKKTLRKKALRVFTLNSIKFTALRATHQ